MSVKIPLNRQARNYAGTIYGGSMHAAIDPIYKLIRVGTLGKNYIVWENAAAIRCKRPGRETLFADFVLTAAELAEIKAVLQNQKSVDRIYNVEIKDGSGVLLPARKNYLYCREIKLNG